MKTLPCCIALFLSSICCFAFDDKPKQLNQTELDNLVAFANLYGYVRHFHPSDEAMKTDWDAFALNGIKTIEAAKDNNERLTTLSNLFKPVAPSLQIGWAKDVEASTNTYAAYAKDAAKVRYWKHSGYGDNGFTGIMKLFNPYVSKVKTIKTDDLAEKQAPSPDSLFFAELPGGIGIKMPVTLYVKSGNTLPKTDFKKAPKAEYQYRIRDRSTRYGDVVIAWNVLKFFYPYWKVTPVDWDRSLVNALQKSSTDTIRGSFGETLAALIADLQDGHGNTYFNYKANKFAQRDTTYKAGNLPMQVDLIEDKVVITYCENCDSLGVKRGDIVKTINGKEAREAFWETEKLISAPTEQWKNKLLYSYYSFNGEKDSVITFGLEDAAGKPYERTLTMRKWKYINTFDDSTKIKALENGIYYVNLGNIKGKDFKKALPELKTASGIIFDNRCYPKTGPSYLRYLTNQKFTSARWMVPVVTYPETLHTEFDTSGRWKMKPKEPYLACPKVFLTNGWAISYAESVMGIVEAYKMGEIVGEPTAGTNGNINMVGLPSGYQFIFTGMQVLKHDGSQHHRVGIQPTVACSQTIAGVREGRDVQLEKAVEVVKAAGKR